MEFFTFWHSEVQNQYSSFEEVCLDAYCVSNMIRDTPIGIGVYDGVFTSNVFFMPNPQYASERTGNILYINDRLGGRYVARSFSELYSYINTFYEKLIKEREFVLTDIHLLNSNFLGISETHLHFGPPPMGNNVQIIRSNNFTFSPSVPKPIHNWEQEGF